TVCGIPGAHCEIAMLRAPDGGSRLELASFITPDHLPGTPTEMPNEVGLRNVSFEVDDLQAALDRVAEDGYGLVGGVGQYENQWRMAYVRGPDGIILSLAEPIGSPKYRAKGGQAWNRWTNHARVCFPRASQTPRCARKSTDQLLTRRELRLRPSTSRTADPPTNY
ncbi:MAG: VOC family protein, partial [Chloroflexi bacterium]|nr:VOC family protein [Chloroflexota bacterium]